MAKAAIAAGIQILLNEKGIIYKDVKRLILAGGFGTYLNKESAARIGLIPKELLPVTQAVGNAAGEGAISAAISKEAREQAKKIREHMYYIELSIKNRGQLRTSGAPCFLIILLRLQLRGHRIQFL